MLLSSLFKVSWKLLKTPLQRLQIELMLTKPYWMSVMLRLNSKRAKEILLKLTETKPKKNLKSKLPDGTLMSLLTKT